jgi:hypothetical protein
LATDTRIAGKRIMILQMRWRLKSTQVRKPTQITKKGKKNEQKEKGTNKMKLGLNNKDN